MNVLFGLTEKDSTTGPRGIFTLFGVVPPLGACDAAGGVLPGVAPPLPAPSAACGSKRASSSGSARRVRTLPASAATPDGSHAAADYAACMRVISSSAPFLFRGSLRFPHLGDCTQEGQPDRHGHSAIRRRASATSVSNSVNPMRVIPTPPGWPS